MAIGFSRTATHDLSHVGLALAPRRGGPAWLVRTLVVVAIFGIGVWLGQALPGRNVPAPVPVPDVAASQARALRVELEQARLAQRLSDARSQELERQIDALNQRLSEAHDELTFFRKAHEGKH
ncbi:MAG: hypothetical protein M3Y55_15615 [Pseudomonadota bacterium]|nr:hypothetical protein [Pseudomonadota bacterium]